MKKKCQGISTIHSPGSNPYLIYPFGLHAKLSLPWDVHVVNDVLWLQSRTCKQWITTKHACKECYALTENEALKGISSRAKFGMHESTPHAYQPIGGLIEIIDRKDGQVRALRLRRENDGRKLAVRARETEDIKRLLMAIGSKRFQQGVEVVLTGLKQKMGVNGMIQLYDDGVQGVWKPKTYEAVDILRGLAFLRLGGARVAEFAHRAMALPGLSTLRQNSFIRPLIASPSMPTLSEVEQNIQTCFQSQAPPTGSKRFFVLMLDEISVEKRPRYDDRTNQVLGICREHGRHIALDFCSETDLEVLFGKIEQEEVHISTEVRSKV